MQTQPVALTEAGMALCMVCIFLVPLAAAGLALVNTGFGRGRSAAHSMLSAMCVFAVAVLVYLLVGFSLQGYAGGPARTLTLGGRSWNLLGSAGLLMRGAVFTHPTLSLVACLQLFSVGIAAIIPLGSGSDRWRLHASCASTALLAGITYPVFAHWVWGGGWLAQLGCLAACGNGAIDAGGAAVIQAVGGLSALSIAWILGPRQGKYEDMGLAIPGHNMPFVLFGCLLTLIGWMGLDSAAAMLFAGAPIGSVPLIAANNLAAASAALLTALRRHPAPLRQARRLHRRQRIRHRPGCRLRLLLAGFTGRRRGHRTGRRPRRSLFRRVARPPGLRRSQRLRLRARRRRPVGRPRRRSVRAPSRPVDGPASHDRRPARLCPSADLRPQLAARPNLSAARQPERRAPGPGHDRVRRGRLSRTGPGLQGLSLPLGRVDRPRGGLINRF